MATVPLDSICGVWLDEEEDAKIGQRISHHVKDVLRKVVVHADHTNISFIEQAKPYIGYFVVISYKSLHDQQFMVYLTSVLNHMYQLKLISNVVLVIADKQLIGKSQDNFLPINLRSIPHVVAPDLDEEKLQQIVDLLSGSQNSNETAIGDVGIGLAWSYFYGYLALILPEMVARIEKSDIYKENAGRMSNKFIIVVPDSGKTPAKFSDVDERFSTIGPLDDGIKKSRAGHPARPYRNFVHKIKNTEAGMGDYYFCGEFATPVLALEKMQLSGQLEKNEMEKQLILFRHTLLTILESNRSGRCKDKALILSYADEEGISLADRLYEQMVTDEPMDVSDNQSSERDHSMSTSAETSSIVTFSKSVVIESMNILCAEDGRIMAERIEKFCGIVKPDVQYDEDSDGVQNYLVSRFSSFNELNPELLQPDVVDEDEKVGGRFAPNKLMVILTPDFKEEVEDVLDKLVKSKIWSPVTTFIVDLPPDVPIPDWLETSGADYINVREKTMWKRIFGSLFGSSSVEGLDDDRWKQYTAGKQPQRDRLPLGTVAEGLAWSYYHNYLTLIGPTIAQRIRKMKEYSERRMPSKMFILLPYTCFSHPTLDKPGEGAILEGGKLEKLTIEIAGNKRSYDTAFQKVFGEGKTYYACVEYCTPVLVMYEMEAEGRAGLSPMKKAAELKIFYNLLLNILSQPSAPEFCKDFHLVYYDDRSESLPDVLVREIKKCL